METPGDDVATIDMLLPALRDREHEAFHELYDLMAGRLIAYAHARLGDRSDAEDVVQDVFVKLTRHVRRFRGDGLAMLAWLYKSTRRRCADVHRKRGRRRERPVARVPDRPDEQRAFPRSVWATVDPVLQAALAELTDDQRDAILLRRVAGFDGDEVAAMMGKERQAIYALCARGESRLRSRLTQPALPPAKLAGEAHVRIIASQQRNAAAARGRATNETAEDRSPPSVWEVEVDDSGIGEDSVDDDGMVAGVRVMADLISSDELDSDDGIIDAEEVLFSDDTPDGGPGGAEPSAGRTTGTHPSDRDGRERPTP